MLAQLGPQLASAWLDTDNMPVDEGNERLLDAALAQFMDVGLRRSSMEDVAKRAGVSRVTIYRRFPQKDRLVEAVMLRECRRLVQQVRNLMRDSDDIGQRMETAFAQVMRFIRDNSLAKRLLGLEPELVLPFLTVKAGPVIAIGTAFIAEQIRIAQKAGDFPAYDPLPVAEIMARLTHSLLLTPQGGIPLMTDAKARAFARAHLLPLLMHGGAQDASKRPPRRKRR